MLVRHKSHKWNHCDYNPLFKHATLRSTWKQHIVESVWRPVMVFQLGKAAQCWSAIGRYPLNRPDPSTDTSCPFFFQQPPTGYPESQERLPPPKNFPFSKTVLSSCCDGYPCQVQRNSEYPDGMVDLKKPDPVISSSCMFIEGCFEESSKQVLSFSCLLLMTALMLIT